MSQLSTANTFKSGEDLAEKCGSLVKQQADETVVLAGAGEQVLGVLVSAVVRVKGLDPATGIYSRDLTNDGCDVGVESCCRCIQMTTQDADGAIVPGQVLVAAGGGSDVTVGASGQYPIGVAVSVSAGGCVDVNLNIGSVPLP